MGELARKPGCPELAATPLELFTPRADSGFTPVEKWLWPISGAVTGFLTMICRNAIYQRPIWSGIQCHILLGGALAYGAILFRDLRYAAHAETNAVYMHYMGLHPEDFPPYERKRYRDVYQPFKPVR